MQVQLSAPTTKNKSYRIEKAISKNYHNTKRESVTPALSLSRILLALNGNPDEVALEALDVQLIEQARIQWRHASVEQGVPGEFDTFTAHVAVQLSARMAILIVIALE